MSFYDGEPIRVDGELTLVGVTHPVPLRVNSYHCTDPVDLELRQCMMDATAIFRRSEFGITGSMPLAGDKVKLTIHAEATADAIPAAPKQTINPLGIQTLAAAKVSHLGLIAAACHGTPASIAGARCIEKQ